MKTATAIIAQIKTTKQIAPMVRNVPDSTNFSKLLPLSWFRIGVGWLVAVNACVGIGVAVSGKLSTISGGLFSVGDGVNVAVGVIVGVFVINVGVKVGGAGVYVRVGLDVLDGLKVRVGVLEMRRVLVAVGVFVSVGVTVSVLVGVGVL